MATGFRVGLLVGLAALLAAPAAWGRDPKFEAFTSDTGRYKASVPGKRRTATKNLSYGADPEQVVKVATDTWEASSVVYTVTTADYPVKFAQVPADKLLDGVRDGLRGKPGLGGKLEFEHTDLTIKLGLQTSDTVPAREVRVSAGKNTIRARMAMHERRLFLVMATGKADDLDAKLVDDYFTAFEIRVATPATVGK